MAQPGGGGGFELEAGDPFGFGQRAGANQFERDQAVEPALPRLIDDAHAAATDFLEQFVIAQLGEGQDALRLFRENQVHGAVRSRYFIRRERLEAAPHQTPWTNPARRVGRERGAAFGALARGWGHVCLSGFGGGFAIFCWGASAGGKGESAMSRRQPGPHLYA